MNNKKLVFQICGLIFCVAVIVYLLRNQDFHLLKQICFGDIAICSLMTVACYSLSGMQYFITLRKMNCNLKKSDILLFPLLQAFFGVIMPFQGTNIFAAYYLKKNYSFKIGKTVTMVLFLYLFNVLFASVAGIIYGVLYLGIKTPLFFVSLLFLFSPLGIKLVQLYFKKYDTIRFFPKTLNDILRDFFNEIGQLCSDRKNIAYLVVCQLFRQICNGVIFITLARALKYQVPILWGYLLAVAQELSVIIKLTPGNIGVAELISGLVSTVTQIDVSAGVSVSLINTLLNILVVLSLGGIASIFILKEKLKIKDTGNDF